MIASKVLKQVAKQVGLADTYTSAWGKLAQVSDQTLSQLLAALGYDIRDEAHLLASLAEKQTPGRLPPVSVYRDSDKPQLSLCLSSEQNIVDFTWRLNLENGQNQSGELQSLVVSEQMIGQMCQVTITLPTDLPWGYHQFELTHRATAQQDQMTLIRTPNACFKQSLLAQGQKIWGPSVQLYTLRSNHNWGIGDFGDLKQLVSDIAARGGQFVGLNPIHALFPANPEAASPYSPSSRRWLNILYIDVCSVPEFSLSAKAQQQVGSESFQRRLQQVRETHWVNYTEVQALKMSVFPLLFEEFKSRHLDQNSARAQDFLSFVEQGGESLCQQATFDALHAHFRAEDEKVWGWQVFPEAYRQFDSEATQQFVRQYRPQVQLYMYLQWLADGQISEAQALAESKGMTIGLYRDLAVGVADSGSEMWADKGQLVLQASIGAPPDVLGPLGQNWGLPPLNPESLKRSGYRAYIDLLRANMKHCGALRIDHVLGLLRLWWIPKGQSATDGAYLYYPVQDMLAILALESHRHRCSVIGEDLGTVPDEIVAWLREAGVHSYKVFFFERSEQDGGFISPSHYPAQSMAALCTHDMPTLRGYWHCDDLKMGEQLGLYPDPEQLKALFDDRLASKQAILDSVRWHGYLPESIGHDAQLVPMDKALSDALQMHLAAGASSLLSVQLEDWLAMDNPVNIPGTVDEYPNWRRKLTTNVDEMFYHSEVDEIARKLSRIRAAASQL